MALTRKFLQALGLEDKHIETIIEAHSETVTALKGERDKAREQAQQVPDLQRQLEEAKASEKSIADLKARCDELSGQVATLTTERDGIKSQFDAYKDEVKGNEAQRAKASAYKGILRQAGIADKYLDTVMRVADLSGIEFEEDGKTVKGADELVKSAKDTWSDFVVKKRDEHHNPPTPPASKGIEGANPIAVQIAQERRARMYGNKIEKEGE